MRSTITFPSLSLPRYGSLTKTCSQALPLPPRIMKSRARRVLPQPALPQTRMGRPWGSPPPVISSGPRIPVGVVRASASGTLPRWREGRTVASNWAKSGTPIIIEKALGFHWWDGAASPCTRRDQPLQALTSQSLERSFEATDRTPARKSRSEVSWHESSHLGFH